MKRNLLICFLIACFSWQTSAQNLIPNGDFLKIQKDGRTPVGWWGNMDSGSGVDQVVRPDSRVNSFRVKGGRMLETGVKVTGGHVYRCSYLLKTENFRWLTAASFQILWKKNGVPLMTGKDKKHWNMTIKNVQGGHDWDYFEMPSCEAPADANGASIRIMQVFDPVGTFWIADVKMEEVRHGSPFRNRIAAVPLLNEKISLDRLENAEIRKKMTRMDDFLLPPMGTSARCPTETYIARDREALWIYSVNYQKMDALEKNKQRNFDSQDGIEIFLLPPGKVQQFHIMLPLTENLLAYKEKWNDGNWPMKLHPWKNHGIQFKIRSEKDFWTAAMRIPFSGMEVASPGENEEWRANFCRTVHSGDSEESSWGFMREPMFQFTEYFGKLVFMSKPAGIGQISITSDGASVQMSNPDAKDMTVELAFVKHSDGKSFISAARTFQLPAGVGQTFDLKSATSSSDIRFLEIRADGRLIRKHCKSPSENYLVMEVYDPENVRTQTVHLAVDTPFFWSFNMRHNFASKEAHALIWRRDIPFDLCLELPREIRLSGMTFDTGDWIKLPLFKPETRHFEQGGRKMTRYHFKMPLIINWLETGFLFFYECDAAAGQKLQGTYYFIRDGKPMPGHGMEFRTMKVGHIRKPFEKLIVCPGLLRSNTLRWWFPENTVRNYKRLGFNRLGIICEKTKSSKFYTGNNPQTFEDYNDLVISDMKKSGEKLFLSTFNTSSGARSWQWTAADPDARSVGADGKPGPLNQYNYPSLCPSYRGKFFDEWINMLIQSSAFTKYQVTWLALDMELWPPEVYKKICFCDRCLARFREFCKLRKRADFAAMDVRKEFLKGENKEFLAFWKEFKKYLYSEFLTIAGRRVEETTRGFAWTTPYPRFIYSDWTFPGSSMDREVFDIYEIAMFNSPDSNFQKLRRNIGILKKRKDIYCSCTYGQTVSCPDFHLTPRQIQENIFEAAAFGMLGVGWYYVLYLEPRRMKAIIDALNIIRPFEDLIIEGRIMENIRSSESRMHLSRLDRGDEMLIGVRSYGSPALTGRVALENIQSDLAVYDLETSRKIGQIRAGQKEFTCSVPRNSCRIFYAGPEHKWQNRMKMARSWK